MRNLRSWWGKYEPPIPYNSDESETLKFKEKFDDRTVESAVAFANAKGDMILIGVSDKGNITGVNVGKETLAKWTKQISENLSQN